MARLARVELFAADEIAVVHVMNRVVRRCFLMGTDAVTGRNYDHRKQWIEDELRRLAAYFAIDLLAYSIMSNHFHLVLRSRPDVLREWDDREVAECWLRLCPTRRTSKANSLEATEADLNALVNDPDEMAEIRSRLSDISWWMRLLCQRIAQRANREDEAQGKFWESRYRAVRLLDEAAILACTAYVDLNPIRSGLAGTIDECRFTSASRRIEALLGEGSGDNLGQPQTSEPADAFLSRLPIDEQHDELGSRVRHLAGRCSNKGFLPMTTAAYVELLDWTARETVPGKGGKTAAFTPPVFKRLGIKPEVWCQMVSSFGTLFSLVAGRPTHVDEYRSRITQHRYRLSRDARLLLSA